MNDLLRAEARKLLTTRSALLVAGFVVIYPVLGLIAVATAPGQKVVEPDALLQMLRGEAELLQVAMLLLGILAVTAEYRHGTIVPTLLAVPRRSRVLAAKLTTQGAVGIGVSLAAAVLCVAAGAAYRSSRTVGVDILTTDVVLMVAAVAAVAALFGTIGVAIGALVRNQTAAVAGALIWVLTIENVVPIVLRQPGLRRWLPGGAAERLLEGVGGPPGVASPWPALVLLIALAVGLTVAAMVRTKAADIA